MTEVQKSEGEIPFDVPDAGKPCKTWYTVLGSLGDTTSPALIGLHGGPGAGHEYLVPLADLYSPYGIPTVLYDQIGCGRSTHLREKAGDAQFWSFDLFIAELDNLIDYLGLRERGFFLLGQSWGGVLAAVYASRRPAGLRKLVLASAPASIPLYVQGLQGLLAQLPDDVRQTLEECDRKGDHESEEFQEAAAVFNERFVCQLDPLPEEIVEGFRNMKKDPTVYFTIQGPAEFVITGSIKDFEGWKQAHTIEVETLLLNGKNDEVTSSCMYPWFHAIPKIRWVTLDGSHMSHWEDRERFMREVGDFLAN
ncbi:L-amino acid amidase [Lachnellula suecica]|uniref:L-amino acid amidase n=1 Tax=Lachnellula suecica TaxID=602035 RepID=A0A8T9C4W7_9HELO|nr:L-amino acid amidase [Lachnellula suecica]